MERLFPEHLDTLGSDTSPWARRHLVEALVGGLTLVAAWIIIAVSETIPAFEEALFRAINGLPDWVEYVGWLFMQFGSFIAIPLVAAVSAVAFRSRRLALELLSAGMVGWTVAPAIKAIVGRERPGGVLTDIELRPLWHGLGFPSGHATVSAALAAVLSVWVRGWWLVAVWTIPVVVGFMRIYTGAHFPLDVIAGWGLGVLIGTGVAWLGRTWAGRRSDAS